MYGEDSYLDAYWEDRISGYDNYYYDQEPYGYGDDYWDDPDYEDDEIGEDD